MHARWHLESWQTLPVRIVRSAARHRNLSSRTWQANLFCITYEAQPSRARYRMCAEKPSVKTAMFHSSCCPTNILVVGPVYKRLGMSTKGCISVCIFGVPTRTVCTWGKEESPPGMETCMCVCVCLKESEREHIWWYYFMISQTYLLELKAVLQPGTGFGHETRGADTAVPQAATIREMSLEFLPVSPVG